MTPHGTASVTVLGPPWAARRSSGSARARRTSSSLFVLVHQRSQFLGVELALGRRSSAKSMPAPMNALWALWYSGPEVSRPSSGRLADRFSRAPGVPDPGRRTGPRFRLAGGAEAVDHRPARALGLPTSGASAARPRCRRRSASRPGPGSTAMMCRTSPAGAERGDMGACS